MASALTSIGANVAEHEDGLTIVGTGGEALRGSDAEPVKTHLDHRIAMSMAVAGLASKTGVEVDDSAPIQTSFPNFMDLLAGASAS
jgi:3-phosphoshikimate 1-carboxyvinyltransferase